MLNKRRLVLKSGAALAEPDSFYQEVIRSYGMYPLDSPGMPLPGPGFIAAANAANSDQVAQAKISRKNGVERREIVITETLSELYHQALRARDFTMSVQVKPGYFERVQFVPGHIWGTYYHMVAAGGSNNYIPPNGMHTVVRGPVPARVMVLGKCLGIEEANHGAQMVGPSARTLVDALRRVRISGAESWYVTSLIKYALPGGSRNVKSDWQADCLPLLWQELRIVRPELVVCLGGDAAKALLGKHTKVTETIGRAIEFSYPINLEDQPDQVHKTTIMTVWSPSDVARDPSKQRILDRGLQKVFQFLGGTKLVDKETDIDHRVIRTYEEAVELLKSADRECDEIPYAHRFVAWDAEWQGQHPQNPGSYLRTVQMSWQHKKAAVFVLTDTNGDCAFFDEDGDDARSRLFALLQNFMADKRTCGHFLTADLEWLDYFGLDLIKSCRIPQDKPGKPGYKRLRKGHGWLDSAAMAHAVEETGALGLESLSFRYTTVPRYELALEEWKKRQKTETKEGVSGYGVCPDEVLLPYSLYDADATRRCVVALLPLIEKDHDGRSNWEPLWSSLVAMESIRIISRNGIGACRDSIDQFSLAFFECRAALEANIRERLAWPSLNFRSVPQMKELLFGELLSGNVNKEGDPVRVRPPGAKSLNLRPLLTTDKPPRRWDDVERRGETRRSSPSTNKLVMGIYRRELADQEKRQMVADLLDQRFLDQVLKTTLRPPSLEEDGSGFVEDDEGNMVYEGGLYSHICSDKRVRSFFVPFAETARWKSRRPNMQNNSKSRDKDYKRLLKEKYKRSLRSIFVADPGYAFVDMDYKGAELFGMAILSGDKQMIDHAMRSALPDEGYDEKGRKVPGGKFPHPNYYDIHSNVAKVSFRLDCMPTKQGLISVGMGHIRNAAKSVIFGIAYGRGAKAVALQLREEGITITEQDAEGIVATIFNLYPNLRPFFDEAKRMAIEEGYVKGCFNRYRRFPKTSDEQLQAEFGRQAMNFPLQNLVAEVVNRGLYKLLRKIEAKGLQNEIRLVLQLHDAITLEVKNEYIEWVVDQLLPATMIKGVPIYPQNLRGELLGTGPYFFASDVAVEKRWGEKLTVEIAQREGIPLRFAHTG